MKRWGTHQLVSGGLLDQPTRLWREVESALDEEEIFYEEQEAVRRTNERLKAEAAATATSADDEVILALMEM